MRFKWQTAYVDYKQVEQTKKISHCDTNVEHVYLISYIDRKLWNTEKGYKLAEKAKRAWEPKRIAGNKIYFYSGIYLYTGNCMCAHSDYKCRWISAWASCSLFRWQLPHAHTLNKLSA